MADEASERDAGVPRRDYPEPDYAVCDTVVPGRVYAGEGTGDPCCWGGGRGGVGAEEGEGGSAGGGEGEGAVVVVAAWRRGVLAGGEGCGEDGGKKG